MIGEGKRRELCGTKNQWVDGEKPDKPHKDCIIRERERVSHQEKVKKKSEVANL